MTKAEGTGPDPIARLAAAMRKTPARFASPADLVREAAVSARQLETLFVERYHATPGDYIARARVAAALGALADPQTTIADAGARAGFEDRATFDEAFLLHTGMRPAEYRQLERSTRFTVRLPPGYRPEFALRIIGRDRESPSERVDGRRFVKAIPRDGAPLRIDAELRRQSATCTVSSMRGRIGGGDMRRAHAVVLRMLGLHLDPSAFERRIARKRALRVLVNGRAGLRVPLTADLFEALAWAIVGQQINLPFAYRLRRVLIERAGTAAGDGLRAHPTPASVAKLDYADLTSRQYSRRKAEYVIDTARAIATGALPLADLALEPVPVIEQRLTALRGVGPWTTQYMLMRGFGHADAVPAGDSALAAALGRFFRRASRPDARETRELMRPFAPHRSLATFHFWMSLGGTP